MINMFWIFLWGNRSARTFAVFFPTIYHLGIILIWTDYADYFGPKRIGGEFRKIRLRDPKLRDDFAVKANFWTLFKDHYMLNLYLSFPILNIPFLNWHVQFSMKYILITLTQKLNWKLSPNVYFLFFPFLSMSFLFHFLLQSSLLSIYTAVV